jgi:hypothetical protein
MEFNERVKDPTKSECLVTQKVGRMNRYHWTANTTSGLEVQERGSASIPGSVTKVRGALTYEEWCIRNKR